jgi:hypothetical protein
VLPPEPSSGVPQVAWPVVPVAATIPAHPTTHRPALHAAGATIERSFAEHAVPGADQRVSREGALKAITIDAAYSLQMEKEVGCIVPGKPANFTILADNAVTCDAAKIKEIAVISTVHEGRLFPIRRGEKKSASYRLPDNVKSADSFRISTGPRHTHNQGHTHGHSGCGCSTSKILSTLMFSDDINSH